MSKENPIQMVDKDGNRIGPKRYIENMLEKAVNNMLLKQVDTMTIEEMELRVKTVGAK
jgi:hypothetical protein